MSTPNKPTVEELTQSMLKTLHNDDQQSNREFIDDVMDQIATPPAQIPEAVFRELFLPYLIGEKSPVSGAGDDGVDRNPIAHWIGLVGSASEPANVVDAKGEVVFQVPPMYDSSQINTTGRAKDAHNFETIFTVFAEESRISPARGGHYLIDQLSRKASVELGSDTPPAQSWRPVLEYYHLLPKEGEKAEPSSKAVSDDDLDFGD